MSINFLRTTALGLGMIGAAVGLRAQPSAGVASKDANRLARTIPGSTKILIDNSGHMPRLEQSAEFKRLVREYLTTKRVTSTQQ